MQVSSTSAFLGMLGVDTHLSYTDGGYAKVANVVADLKYLGISKVRDSIPTPSHLASYEAVAKQGVSFTLTLKGQTQDRSTLASSIAEVRTMLKDVPGSVTAVEGSNEVNNWPVTYNGVGGLQGAVALQKDLYAAVHGDPALQGVAVDYFTGYGAGSLGAGPDPSSVAGLADFDNQHPYPANGQAPQAFINPARALNNETSGHTGAFVYTETGYSSNGGTAGAVSQSVQAKYTLDLLFDAMRYGASQVYLYDLLDAYAPGSRQGDDGFGLFDENNRPKLAATALHNLTTILGGGDAAPATTTANGFAPTITGLPATGQSLVLQKTAQTFDLAIWAEPQIWSKATGTEVAAAHANVNVDLGARYGTVLVYDPLTGSAPIASYANIDHLSLDVTDHPLIVEVSGKVPAGPVTVKAALGVVAGGITVNDTAAAIVASLPTLAGMLSRINAVNVTDGTISVGASIFGRYAAVLDKISGGFSLTDTAAEIRAQLPALGADNHLTGITATDGPVTVSAADFAAGRPALDKIAGGFTVTDGAGAIAAALDSLAGDSGVNRISLTRGTLAVSVATLMADRAALDVVDGGFVVSDSAQAIAASLPFLGSDPPITAIQSTNGSVGVSAGTCAAQRNVLDLITSGVTVTDTATALQASLDAIATDAKITSLVVTTGLVTVSTARFASVQSALDRIVGGFAAQDRAAAILSAIDALAADGNIASITATGGTVDVSAATFAADRAALDKITGGFTVTDTAAHLAGIAALIGGDTSVTAVTTIGSGGGLVARATYSAGQLTSNTQYNANGSVFSKVTVAWTAQGESLWHYAGGSVYKAMPYTSLDVDIAQDGSELYRRYTYGNNSSNMFNVSGNGLQLLASHNDTFHVTGHAETFVFQRSFGKDVIEGFTADDTVSLSHNLFANFADVLKTARGTTDTTISDARGNTLTLVGIAPDHLTANMFKFT